MLTLNHLPSPSAVYAAYASVSASVMLIRTTFHQIIPSQLQDFLLSTIIRIFKRANTRLLSLVIHQFDAMSRNDLYDSFQLYMSNNTNCKPKRLKLTKSSNENDINIRLAQSETLIDYFEGIKITWLFVCEDEHGKHNSRKVFNDSGESSSIKQWFELSIENVHQEFVINSYIPFVLEEAKAIRNKNKVVKLHTLDMNYLRWDSINLEHPSTFENLAMEPSEKKALLDDLDLFVQRKGYYKRVGRAWKRGYLLYGPPGTGKSSLIAAMANYLKFDVYDLQLMNVKHDSDLRKLLLGTANQSILVIEDIDCSVEIPERRTVKMRINTYDLQPFTLSGLLNFVDGLWSSCGDERIIIFTTNDKDKLDPALLRPGRMDKHIHMSYLSANGFKILASKYLDIKEGHWRYREIEELIGNVEVTPAEVAQQLMKTSDVDDCLEGLVNFLNGKKRGRSSEDIADEIQVIPEAKRIKTNGGEVN